MPAFWLNYFAVADCAQTVERTRQIGGVIQREPTPIPDVGTFALISDPQGAGFGILEPQMTT